MEHGGDAQPGRALLALAKGDLDQAVGAARRTLVGTRGAIFRHRVIPGCVEVLLAGSPRTEDFGCAAVRAGSETVAAQVALAREDPESALQSARSALGRWSALEAGYEGARARVLVGRALRLLGDEDGAVLELSAAREVFLAQGAAPDARDVAELLGETGRPGGLTAREVEVLCLVAAGRSNAQVALDLHLSARTVARHLSNIFTKLDVGSRTEAAAFAYRHGLC